ncbi:bifunctional folylpolyglutamate synthase/dihydrofolate synthase [Schleiferia thermophila]|uniref:bifunctional folylpolyglutamate synthase/dihydrofolate synthase n=1 Tax=Schleiferia thermophila TaxID=884107 RepID=UPI001FD59AA5|nr:folylpolyglutamate synthase/dihydrofolate synthase family protein [Schleiferia thermophila]
MLNDYESALSWLMSQLPFFQRQGHTAYKPGLERSLALMNWLGHPEKKFKSIHVGGTNGKGSTSHLIAAALQTKGLKTGLYTSPHLYDFRERIRINGQKISKEYVVDFVNKFRSEALLVEPSFFELTMAMAFSWFADERVDIAVIEVGMGGRLDSTNVITPMVSVITNIGWDHMQFLGDTLPKIAQEKAGIIKPNTSVVIGERQAEVEEVFISAARSKGSNLIFASEEFKELEIECGLQGTYQRKNVKTAYAALQLLPDKIRPNESEIREAFRNVKKLTEIRGRWEILQDAPLVIADTAHNYNGIAMVMNQLKEVRKGLLFMVWGMVSDKDAVKIFSLLPGDALYLLCKPDVPRAMPIKQLEIVADKFNLNYESYDHVIAAYTRALELAGKSDTIFIGGSTFVVGDLLKHLDNG